MRLKKDTIEYNTAAFKTNPGAVVEDLLKKLPGLDVDRAGNVKAMGEDIKRVLVDNIRGRVERVSELNFLREKRSNMLGRFFMISFKYRLNKFGETPGGIDIKVNRR